MKTSLFAVFTATLMTMACNSQMLADTGITAKVKGKLAEDSQTSAIKISVSTTNGVVTLGGTVPTDTEKSRAEQIARQTDGVKKVVNEINVDAGSVGASNAGEKVDEAKKQVEDTARDKLILGKIESKLVVAGISGASV